MKITLRFFAQLKEDLGTSQLVGDFKGPLSCHEALMCLVGEYPGAASLLSRSALARNGHFAAEDALLEEGDELAVLPPSSGG